MDECIQRVTDYLAAGESAVGLLFLAAAAFFEYVFPPFPGDAVTLFGAFLASTARWHVASVFAAVTAGSVAGASVDYALGRRLAARRGADLSPRKRALREKLDRIARRFERHGALYLCLNRFFPGIRALFFVAAGYAHIPLGRTLAFGALSAALWNGAVIGIGFAVGENFDTLRRILANYTSVAWGVLALVALVLAARFLWRRGKKH